MLDRKIFLMIAIICLVLYIISLFIHKKEGFENPSSSPAPTSSESNNNTSSESNDNTSSDSNNNTSSDSNNNTSSDASTPTDSNGCPAQLPWWLRISPNQIVSLTTGVRFPIIPNKTSGVGINADFQVPFIKAGDTEATGCISIDPTIGTYSTQICNVTDIRQLWNLKLIQKEEDLRAVLNEGNVNGNYSGLRNPSTSAPLQLPPGISYGFFMVISKNNKTVALASNGGNLTIQSVGVFTSQFWDISQLAGQSSIAYHDTVDYTQLGTNYSSSQTALGPGDILGGLNPLTGYGLTSDPSIPYQRAGKKATDRSSAVNFNINLNTDLMKTFLGIDGESGDSTSATPSVEGFANLPPSGINPKCKPCPSELLDFISKNNIPCLGCKLD